MEADRKEDALKIDLHTHILPRQWPNLKQRYGYSGWIEMHRDSDTAKTARLTKDDGTLFRVVDENTWSLETRLMDMNRNGINVQVLSTVPVMFNYWAKAEDTLDLCRLLNDHIAECTHQYPSRFLGIGTLPMQKPELAVAELKRCVLDLRLGGVQIGTHINDWNLDARQLDPIYKAAEDLGCGVFVHPWDMDCGGRMSKYWLPWLVGMPNETTTAICSMLLGGVFERFPGLRVCFAHGGGSFPYTLGRISHGFSVRPDLCAVETRVNPRDFINRIYVDSLVHDPEALMFLVKVMGEDRVMLGSDYPFPLGETHPGSLLSSIHELGITAKDKIFGGNALDFLQVDCQRFV